MERAVSDDVVLLRKTLFEWQERMRYCSPEALEHYVTLSQQLRKAIYELSEGTYIRG